MNGLKAEARRHGYLRASGYFAIRPFLSNVPHIRILVGINVDGIMSDYHRRGVLFMPDPTKALEEFKNDLRRDIQGAAYSKQPENGILQFVEDVASKKISIRAHPTQRLHAKSKLRSQKGEVPPGAETAEIEGWEPFAWKNNGLRHSYISYRLAAVPNTAQVALEAGNSPQMIFQHYRELVRAMDGER